VNRNDFQELAELHLKHARALLDAGLYSGAYYMCGYVVECALKACICKSTDQFDFHPGLDYARKAWSHKFDDLIGLAELRGMFETDRKTDKSLDIYWRVVAGWNENSRYSPRGEREAKDLLTAVSDPEHGVLACIKQHW
jgi:HEPN domain-containing protein